MFKLFRRVIGGQQAVCDCLRGYLREQATLVNEKEAGESGKNAITYIQVFFSDCRNF